jgi:hypothetical protein
LDLYYIRQIAHNLKVASIGTSLHYGDQLDWISPVKVKSCPCALSNTPWTRTGGRGINNPLTMDQSPWEVVAQLVKKFPDLYGTRRFITMFTRVHHWSVS